ncbi:hypothetical protein, partial [Thermoleptolyngbya sp.]
LSSLCMANENGYRPSQFSQSLRVHNSNRNAISRMPFQSDRPSGRVGHEPLAAMLPSNLTPLWSH